MYNIKTCLLLLMSFYSGCICGKWPKYVKRCALDDPQLNKCLIETARKTIPYLANGVKDWGLPALEPFRYPTLTFYNNNPPLNLTFRMTNGTILDCVTAYSIQKMRYNLKRNELHFLSSHKQLRMSGNYQLKGQIFSFNVNSRGTFNVIFRDIAHNHTAKFRPSKNRNGYSDIKMDYHIRSMGQFTFDMDDENMSDSLEEGIVNVINNNWEIVSRLLIPTGEQGFEVLLDNAITPLFKRFKFSEIFPSETAQLKILDCDDCPEVVNFSQSDYKSEELD